jgi:carboxylesterase
MTTISDTGAILPNVQNSQWPACLVLHGLGGGPYELEPLLAALEGEGLPLDCPVLPGHSGPGPLMPASVWRDWADVAERSFDELATSGRPVAVIGFSTGATVALHVARTRPVARQVLLAPFLTIRFTPLIPLRPAVYLRWLARFFPNLPRRKPAVGDLRMRDHAHRSSLFRTFSVPSALSALELIDELSPVIGTIQVPTLIIQGRRDTVVEPATAAWLYQNLGSVDKRLIYLDQSEHLLALDSERERVINETKAFLLGA